MLRQQIIAALIALPVLSACETPPSNQDIGMATGAILGGVLGHQIGKGTGQTVATIGGAALGALAGSRIGKKMDQADQLETAQALEKSPDGQATAWRNPNTGQSYKVKPTRTYNGASGPCRDFTTVAEIDGKQEVVHGKACRQPDGTWRFA